MFLTKKRRGKLGSYFTVGLMLHARIGTEKGCEKIFFFIIMYTGLFIFNHSIPSKAIMPLGKRMRKL